MIPFCIESVLAVLVLICRVSCTVDILGQYSDIAYINMHILESGLALWEQDCLDKRIAKYFIQDVQASMAVDTYESSSFSNQRTGPRLPTSQSPVLTMHIALNDSISTLRRSQPQSTTSSESGNILGLPTLSHNIIGTTVTGCSITVPWATGYQWNFQTTSPSTAIPTNSAGTRVETIEITTGMREQDGRQVFQITRVQVTFPTPFTGGANMFVGVSDHRNFQSFFPTVFSLPQHTAFPFAAPSQDPHGYFFELRPTKAPVNSISYFRSVYPQISELRTCHAVAFTGPAFNPPGLVVPTQLARPTLFTPAGPSGAVRSTATSVDSDTHAVSFSTTLDSTSISIFTTQKTDTTTPGKMVTSPASARTTTASREVKASSVHSSNVPKSSPAKSTSSPQSATSIRAKETSPPRHPTDSGSNFPTIMPTSTASTGIRTNATRSSPASQELKSVSVVSGTVLVYGNTLATGTTLTLGSGSVLTAVALTTNSIGQTVLFGNITSAHFHPSSSTSSVASIVPTIPSAVPTSINSPAPISTTGSTAASANIQTFIWKLRIWIAICILHAAVR